MTVPTRPRLRTQFYLWSEPPDASGDETLHFASHRRRVTLKGQSFREFERLVVPLLDGRHTIDDIQARVAHVFARQDLEKSLAVLASQALLDDAPETVAADATPHDRYFTELGVDPQAIAARLSAARVLVLGLGPVGAGVAQLLSAAGVGSLRCVDGTTVRDADRVLSPVFGVGDIGALRVGVVARAAARVDVVDHMPSSDDELIELVRGADAVVSCLDAGWSWLQYRLNRACLAAGIPWTTGTTVGTEVVMGPTIRPRETACWMCYKMRAVACAPSPDDAFAFERMLDRRRRDDTDRQDGLLFGSGILANQLGLETVSLLSGALTPAALGRIVVTDLLTMTTTRHKVLRKPWCPDCFA
jgi:molybdopterin-synthase adenylyltransferase